MGFKLQESESFIRKRLVIKTDGRFLFLDQNEIVWLEAEGNYVQIHTNQNPVLMRRGISTLEKELAPNFIRISRSTIVNLNYVREMRPWMRGNNKVVMTDGSQLTLTHGFRNRLNDLIGIPLGIRSGTL
ncbi:LytTR family transcriptional regulator [bacterium]|nr:LytTR family transcriptional regulator [bacterium]